MGPLLSVGILMALPGCARETPRESTGSSSRDSAGIVIVESTAPHWDVTEGWALSPEPLVTIGSLDGPDEEILFQVQAAVRLDDGRIVLGDNGTMELRFYDAAGRHLFSRGGEGEGPGEFQWISTIWPAADSLFVFDIRLMRVSVYSLSGELGRSYRVAQTSDGGYRRPIGLFSNRHLLVEQYPSGSVTGTGFYRDTATYALYSPVGTPWGTLGRLAGSENYRGRQGETTFVTEAPFGRKPSIIAAGERLIYGSGDSYEIQIFSANGVFERIIRRPVPNPELTAAEIDVYREEEFSPDAHPIWQDLYARMEFPETKPAYGRLVVDTEGNIWVAEYTHRFIDPGTWDVFDPEGVYLGSVETPDFGRVFEIGSDYVIGVWADELDMEQVKVYRLMRSTRPAVGDAGR
jgi:hypothetical protein